MLLCSSLVLGVGGGARAQGQAEPDFSAQNPDDAAFRAEAKTTRPFNRMIQTLIVTARKTEERVQQVPVSLTAIPNEEITRQNLRRLDDIQDEVPNLLFDQGTGLANTARTSLRGLSQSDNSSAADPVIGIYVDGVFRTRLQASVLSLFDIDRIEVLRGPQGALFGKNTIGGAINITTKQPEFEFGGDAEVRVGNFDLFETRLNVNVPIVPERAAARFSIATSGRDGYIKNVTNGDDYADNRLLGGRAQFLVLPREDVEINLSLESTIENRKGFGAKCFNLPISTANPTGALAGALGFPGKCAEDAVRSDFKTAGDVSFTGDELKTFAATNRLTWDITPDLTLTSISGWRRQKINSFFNVDSTDIPLLQFQNDGGGDSQNQFSQEFQLTGITGGGRLRYVAGLFALKEEANETEFFGPGFIPSPFVMGLPQPGIPQGFPQAAIPTDPGVPRGFNRNPGLNENQVKVDNLSYAFYGQGTYSITERLDFTFGARLTKDRKRVFNSQRVGACRTDVALSSLCLNGLQIPGGPQIPPLLGGPNRPPMGPNDIPFAGFESTGRFDNISPSATLAYAFSPKILGYVSYVTGFQSGGFDGNAASLADTVELANEEITSYEIGFKSSFMDDRLLLNASYFYNVLEDGTRIQVPRITDGGQIAFSQTLDTGALVRGGEFEFGYLPFQGLQLRATLGVQRGELDNFNRGNVLGIGSDALLPAVPNYTMNFVVDYERPIGSLGTVGVRTSWAHRGKSNPVIQQTKQLDVSKEGLLDGRLSWELPDGRTEIAAFGTNLLNRKFFNSGFTSGDQFGFGVRFFAPPRFYGLELKRAF